ncbi:MAG: fructose-1,6-bisphosphatase, partial [Duncaniella sp.]|nr:fructose-1,6-bisphosphatase [Duncaniella sp.]
YNPTLADVYFGGKMVDQSGSTAAKIGAVLGRQWDTTTIRNAFFNDECGAPAIGETVVGMTMVNVTPLLPEQMTDMSNFTFSEPSRWQNVAGETMPFFANQTAPLKITEATTVSLNGTCSPDLERVVITGSISETLYNEVEIADGKWSVDFDNDDVIEGATLTVFGFDKSKMPTFARYFIKDPEAHKEEKGHYYTLRQNEEVCDMILDEFKVEGSQRHIINGHVPVRAKKGESPIRANGKLMVIDGGFAKAYHKTTGIAGYTLIYHSSNFELVEHEPFISEEEAIRSGTDIVRSTKMVEQTSQRIRVRDTDKGKILQSQIDELTELLYAVRHGIIKDSNAGKILL